MPEVLVRLSNVPGTEAAMGWAGSHTVVVDRPPGRAGGSGLGFNGAELLGLALGGCFCNDLRYVAHREGVVLATISVEVKVTLAGEPPLATAAALVVHCTTEGGESADGIVNQARASCMVGNSLARGLAISITRSA